MQAAVLLLLVAPAMASAANAEVEQAIRAAIVHKITKFVAWPDGSFESETSPIRFCVANNSQIFDALIQLETLPIHGRQLVVNAITDPLGVAGQCDVLYLEQDVANRPVEWLRPVADQPILTFGDFKGDDQDPSIISITLRDNKVRFSIDVEASQKAGLNIGAQLLQLEDITNRRGGK